LLEDVVDLLRCPVCSAAFDRARGVLRCRGGHSFDVARQGYVNLVPGRGDTPEMVAARAEFLDSGHYRRLDDELADEAAQASREVSAAAAGAVLDLGSGIARHLAAVLDALPDRLGLALDSSTAALRRAARAHPRAAAIGADAWKPLPLRDGVAVIVLSVFAPRNPAEMARVLSLDGALIAVTPTTRHLYELVGSLGLLSVPDDKEDRLDAQLGSHFTLAGRRAIEHSMFLGRDEAEQIVRMGPSAWHVDERSVTERLAALPDPLTVTASMTLSRYVRGRP
jgi:23S rRNA (guanine745-N1)-methyltransferase